MKKIVIFSGTTEGRTLSSILCKQNIHHIVCVATDYGREIMNDDEYVQIHAGRMEIDDMTDYLKNNASMVIDATHPYAIVVSENIKAAAEALSLRYIRVVREEGCVSECNKITYIENIEGLNDLFSKISGNILLTTGSKELAKLNIDEHLRERLFVRVIPSADSIEACLKAGILVKNIIAMQGPFSLEMNAAVIREYNISCMVTKESGAAGGFNEKIEAAKECDIETIVIGRPVSERGMSVDAVAELINDGKINIDLPLIGMGMGNTDCMTVEARRAIEGADVIFGPKRLIKDMHNQICYAYYRADDIIPVIKEHPYKKYAVAFSGDTTFYSGAGSFIRDAKMLIKETKLNIDMKMLPGISSVSYFASLLKINYSEAYISSVHGAAADGAIWTEVRENLYSSENAFILLSGDTDVRRIANMLDENGSFTIRLGFNLSYPDEKIINLSVNEAKEYNIPGLYIAYIHNSKPLRRLLIPVISDDAFVRNQTPMTKEVIRHEVVRELNIKEDDVVYDVGSGTGSVSIEIAKLSPTVSVVAIEKNADAVECMKQNLEKTKCSNVTVYEGDALEVIDNLISSSGASHGNIPDAVFIGGSGGEFCKILDRLVALNRKIRVVATAVSIETMAEFLEIAGWDSVNNHMLRQIAVTDIKQVGTHNMFKAENPVCICSFDIN